MAKNQLKFTVIACAAALAVLMLGRVIWPPTPTGAIPTAAQAAQLMVLSSIESISFLLGILFMIFAWKYFKQYRSEIGQLATVVYFSLSWLLISWWPHDNLHERVGNDLQTTIFIEFAFHLTSIIAAIFVCMFFLKLGALYRREHQERTELPGIGTIH